MKRDKNKSKADRHALLAAAALQDHMARRLRMPGGPVVQPSLQPGAPLTLAQHLGLIPRPPPLLTEDQWTEVHLRSRLRQDSAQECVICREEFQGGAQVLLSCSHTFHRHCLASFERFSRCKTCPLCRAQQYQKKLIRDGEEIYRHKCATRIQATWRGFAARRRYLEYRRHNPPRDERLRKRWAADRLQEENDRLLSAMDDEVGDLDDLFAELDASVAQSRAVCDAALRPLAARLQRELMRDAASELEAEQRPQPAGGRAAAGATSGGASVATAGADSGASGSRNWQDGRRAARSGLLAAAASTTEEEEDEREGGTSASTSSPRERGAAAPPLLESCLVALSLGRRGQSRVVGATASGSAAAAAAPSSGAATASAAATALLYTATATSSESASTAAAAAAAAAPGRPATAAEVDWDAVVARARARGSLECPICLGDISRRGNDGIAWLSCTHCFHVDCIMAFEAFELASGGSLSCPVCRSGYRRRCFAT